MNRQLCPQLCVEVVHSDWLYVLVCFREAQDAEWSASTSFFSSLCPSCSAFHSSLSSPTTSTWCAKTGPHLVSLPCMGSAPTPLTASLFSASLSQSLATHLQPFKAGGGVVSQISDQTSNSNQCCSNFCLMVSEWCTVRS